MSLTQNNNQIDNLNKKINLNNTKASNNISKIQRSLSDRYNQLFVTIASNELYKQAQYFIQLFYSEGGHSTYPAGLNKDNNKSYSYYGYSSEQLVSENTTKHGSLNIRTPQTQESGIVYNRTYQVLAALSKYIDSNNNQQEGGVEIPQGLSQTHLHFAGPSSYTGGAVAHDVWVEGSHGRDTKHFTAYRTKPSPFERLKEIAADPSFQEMVHKEVISNI